MASDPDPRAAEFADARLLSPAFPRNRDPILQALAPLLADESGRALEIGGGPGEHALALALRFPALRWRSSDPDPAAVASAAAWRAEGPSNLDPPILLDAAGRWPAEADGPFRLILAINMVHIAPWAAAEGLFRRAGERLASGGLLVLYGPFFIEDRRTAPSNLAFDADLRRRDPAWGVRRLDALDALARDAGLVGPEIAALPANNFLVAWRRAPSK